MTAEARRKLNSNLLVPSFQRKKNVEGIYRPNSYRVLFENAEFVPTRLPQPLTEFKDHLSPIYSQPPSNLAPRPKRDLRHHNPQPWTASFLRENVSTMLVPVCNVSTHSTKDEQYCWWAHDSGNVSHNKPQYSFDSSSRDAFRQPTETGRGASLRQKFTQAANGIVPVNQLWEKDGNRRVWKERIGYEQHYNCRNKNLFPIRGKRQGALVLDRLSPSAAENFLESSQLPANQQQAAVVDAAAAEANAIVRPGCADKSKTELAFRAPNSVAYRRQFVRPERNREETVASLMQPEFRFSWNSPDPAPFFTQ